MVILPASTDGQHHQFPTTPASRPNAPPWGIQNSTEMQSLLHIAATADAVLAAITTAWAALGEIVTAGALLLAIDRLAAAIRTTYSLGRMVGTITWPAIHWAVAVCRLIDWRFTALVVADCLKVIAAFALTVAATAGPLLVRASELLGRWYSARLVEPITPNQDPIAPLLTPAVVPAPLDPLPAKPAPWKRAARAKPATTPQPQPAAAPSPRPRRQRSVAPAG